MSQTFVIQTQAGNEEKIKHLLSPLVPNNIWIPRKSMHFTRRIGEEKQWDVGRVILFPGYLFIDGEEDEYDDLFIALRNLRFNSYFQMVGVHEKAMREKYGSGVSVSETLHVLSELEMRWIRQLSGEEISVANLFYKRAKIISGPLMGMEAFVRKVDRHKRVMVIALPLFERTQKIVMPFNEVWTLEDFKAVPTADTMKCGREITEVLDEKATRQQL